MLTTNPVLPLGYSPVAEGQLVTVVTCLEMRARPQITRPDMPRGLRLERQAAPDLAAYRDLFRRVGEEFLWSSRLELDDEALRAILHDPQVELFVLFDDAGAIGLVELDFRVEGEGEIAFFGLAAEAVGSGVGWVMMAHALERAWSRPIGRLWVHTCHFDHPKAIAFYRRAGFVPYATLVEVIEDPRLTGHLSRNAAPQIPMLMVGES
ncbi:GNAT family N-acetyltransferase [Rhizobium sp. CC-YZS058]|uniref:GNAT family N-acetyltransferase n=1 Tax=Rhizobium sp. CC-YZS058 TaxID=3042153 RepID=UPI002B060DDA|nr:GNAT family N-acetyltransferase [Rhizobium sp. CC-YZS058]MEA3534241.1 GNAT family N-acetyltransferase [Rhizobium sp. CC-YZS058]